MRLRASLCLLLSLFVAASAPSQPPDDAPFQDDLLDRLAGDWTMTGHVMGDSVRHDAEARWVLRHQFLHLQMTDVNQPPAYAAHVYIGYDSTAHRYVAHWLDTTGGEASTTIGVGHRDGDTLRFRFDYPDAPFRTTFVHRADGTRRLRMRSKNESDDWQPFAAYTMRPARP